MTQQWLFFLLLVAGIFLALNHFLNKRNRAGKKARKQPFNPAWRKILNTEVDFYEKLSAEHKVEFEKRIQAFLATVRIIGVGVTMDDQTKLLVAASGVIPFYELPII